ncbi:MAG: hypothetical protein ACTHXA_09155 [Gulosibacter sp.]|uniref:hypothetical protein n=1 Tax=Gulosibacter sp. TaxID=2817531 RepID=UPI003F909CD7
MSSTFEDQAESFALEVMGTLAAVLAVGNVRMDLTESAPGVISMTTNDPNGIELQVDQKTRMRLEIDLQLIPDSRGRWLKVLRSSYAVVPEGAGNPFFRYDYLSDPHGIPGAHINVHAHRDDLIAALIPRGKSPRSKRRRKDFVESGSLPRVSAFHFPVGGARFRPSLEDILEVAIDEFGLDCREGYLDALMDGRRRFRLRQLAASIRDSPEHASEALRELGYEVSAPANAPETRDNWLDQV